MDDYQRILTLCREWAEKEYARALERGVVGPVVQLSALDLEAPDRVDLQVWPRAELILSLGSRYHDTIGRGFTVLVTTPQGTEVFNLPDP